jgi:Helix-turn-helix domain
MSADVPRDTSQTDDTSQTGVSDTRRIDLAAWLTKAQAAEALGVSTKAIERFTQAGKLEQRFRPQAHGPQVAVYFPDDVRRLALERQPGPPTPFVVPGPTTANGNGAATQQNVARKQHDVALALPGDDPLRAFAAAVVAAVMSQTSQTLPASPTSLLTLEETAAFLRVTVWRVRALIRTGALTPIKLSGRAADWRIRRKDLEQL